MPTYKQNKKAAEKYLAKLDEIKIRIPGGQKATLHAAAQAAGVSVNEYAQRALLAYMGRECWPGAKEEAGGE